MYILKTLKYHLFIVNLYSKIGTKYNWTGAQTI